MTVLVMMNGLLSEMQKRESIRHQNVVMYVALVFYRSSQEGGSTEEVVILEQCELVVHTEVVPGTFKVTRTHVHFFDTRPPSEREVGAYYRNEVLAVCRHDVSLLNIFRCWW